MPWVELPEQRTRRSKTFQDDQNPNRFAWDGSIGSIHYDGPDWKDIDNTIVPSTATGIPRLGDPDYEMVKDDYEWFVLETLRADFQWIYRNRSAPDSYIALQMEGLRWTNDEDQVSQVAPPSTGIAGQVSGTTIDWPDAYGAGRDFRIDLQPNRMAKRLTLSAYPGDPPQSIINGGNPALELLFRFAIPSGPDSPDIYVDGVLWKQNSRVETGSHVEFRLGTETLFWMVAPFAVDSSVDVPDRTGGQFVLRKVGGNLRVGIRVPLGWLQAATYPVTIDPTLDLQVGASADDGDEAEGNGSMDIAGASIEFRSSKNVNQRFWPAFRWVDSGISQGDTITVAYAELHTNTYEDANGNLHFEKAASPPSLTTTSGDITSRTRTTASTSWIQSGVGLNQYVQTPSLVAPLQEVVDSFSPTAFVLIGRPNTDTFLRIRFDAWDGPNAPKLHIEYTTGGVTLSPAPVTATFSSPIPTISPGPATLSPAAVSSAWAVPAPTIQAPKTLTPAAVAASWATPTPTVQIGAVTLTPAAITGSWATPTATLSIAPLTLSPAAVTSSWVQTGATIDTGTVLSPAPVVAPWAVPTPVVSIAPISLTPAAVAASWAVPIPTVQPGAVTLTPAAVTSAWVQPGASIDTGTVLSPTPTVSNWVVPTPAVSPGPLTISALPVSSSWSVPTPAVSIGPVTLAPAPITAAWASPIPTVSIGPVTLAPSAVSGSWAVPAPTVQLGSVTLTPAPISSSWAVPVHGVSAGPLTVSPSPVTASWGLPAHTIVPGPVTLSPPPVTAAWAQPGATVQEGGTPQTLTPGPVSSSWNVPVPTIDIGPITLSPASVSGSWNTPTPSLAAQKTLSPTSTTGAFAVPTPAVSKGPVSVSPLPISGTLSVPAPLLSAQKTLSASPVSASYSVPPATVALGTATLTPASVVGTFSVPVPDVVPSAQTLLPSPITIQWTVVAPGIFASAQVAAIAYMLQILQAVPRRLMFGHTSTHRLRTERTISFTLQIASRR